VRRTLKMVSLVLLLVFAIVAFLPEPKTIVAAQEDDVLEIYGAVDTPLNLTYAQLASFPLVSEVARLKCVTGSPDVTYNWTGVPLFYLLTLAQIRPEAYKIITRCSDLYTSDLLVEEALKPTTILALEADGGSLPQLQYGPARPYRLVIPGKFGYKWASGIRKIEVVTTDYKGTWEYTGYSDEANVPDYGPMPTPTPPLQTLDIPYGNKTFEVGAFTNASAIVSSFDPSEKTLSVNVTVPEATSGFINFMLQQSFLSRPLNVTLDGKAVSPVQGNTNTTSYLYLALEEGDHTLSILGTQFGRIPEVVVSYPATVDVGQNVTFDASGSLDVGFIVSYEWSFGDGTTGTGPVVSHVYDKSGTYQVELNVTNDVDVSSLKTFTITVGGPLVDIVLLSKIFLATLAVVIVLIFGFLVIRRRAKRPAGSARDAIKDGSFHLWPGDKF
jgi:Oxidoreductase molybdopterin binding domain/PKD domain